MKKIISLIALLFGLICSMFAFESERFINLKDETDKTYGVLYDVEEDEKIYYSIKEEYKNVGLIPKDDNIEIILIMTASSPDLLPDGFNTIYYFMKDNNITFMKVVLKSYRVQWHFSNGTLIYVIYNILED